MNRITALAATVALTAGSLALAAPTQAAPARAYKVTAKANIDTAIAKEDVVKVRGRVTPKAAGQKVILQQRVGNKKKWTSTGNAKVKKNGTYLLKDKPTTPGSREYRVLKPGAKGVKKGWSKPVQVQVYRWEKLASRGTGPQENVIPSGVTIGTDYYANSLLSYVSGTPGYAEYTLGRKCVSLSATYALADSSVSGSSGAVTVTTDGELQKVHSLAVGTIVADDVVDLTGVYRLRFDLSTTATPAAVAAVATPMVLCTR